MPPKNKKKKSKTPEQKAEAEARRKQANRQANMERSGPTPQDLGEEKKEEGNTALAAGDLPGAIADLGEEKTTGVERERRKGRGSESLLAERDRELKMRSREMMRRQICSLLARVHHQCAERKRVSHLELEHSAARDEHHLQRHVTPICFHPIDLFDHLHALADDLTEHNMLPVQMRRRTL
jgi:hypothetical protein